MLTYSQFLEYYNKNNTLPYPLSLTTKRKLTETELKYKYENYKKRVLNSYSGIKKISTNFNYSASLNKILKEIHNENNLIPYYRFYNSLKLEYKKILDSLLYLCPKDKNNKIIFDACHYIERSKNKIAALDKSNIVLLPRPLHTALDTRDNIFLNTRLTDIEHNKWWEIILTKDIKNMLDNKYLSIK